MKKILYFYQYFTTPKGSYGTRVYEFSKVWIERGYQVTVVTSVFSKSDLQASKFLESQIIDGINLKIINVKVDNKQSFLRRIFSFVTYSLISCYYSLFLKYDIVISSSGPITTGIPGLLAKIFRNKKFVFEVRDLWPEAPIELGVIKNKFLIKISYLLEETCYKYADLIISLSPGMKNNIKSRFPYSNIKSVTNSANMDLFNSKSIHKIESKLLSNKFAIYTGNIGEVNNSELLLRAAIYLEKINRKDIIIVLIGDGQQKEILKKKSKNLSTIMFLDLMPKIKLISYIKNSIASVIPLKNIPMLSTSSPNKLYESMAAGVPVIQTTNGWIKKFLNDSKAGFTVSSTNEKELVDVLVKLADNLNLKNEVGKAGYNYAKKHFDKNILALKMLNYIKKI